MAVSQQNGMTVDDESLVNTVGDEENLRTSISPSQLGTVYGHFGPIVVNLAIFAMYVDLMSLSDEWLQ